MTQGAGQRSQELVHSHMDLWAEVIWEHDGHNHEDVVGENLVAAHGKVVLAGLERAVQNMDNIKQTYAELSVLHSEKLQVDPDNFKLLADCLTIVVGSQLGKNFTPEVHAAFQKFLAVVVSALRKQYH
ncbi:hemoglobin subunit beta-1-like [Odontesthes bonariensis]|uniref:hemoglobin subunit beta-1-like n=1 Tax=Odontesthes bonariensis TaxID=219752 RepID=UPI003F58831B